MACCHQNKGHHYFRFSRRCFARSDSTAWQAGAVMRYTQATADALHAPAGYMRAVMTAEPVPNPPQPATTPGGNLP